MQEIINSCKKLKYFNCIYHRGELFSSINCCSLQELCLVLRCIHLNETFVTAISSHGGLVHVVVDVKSMSGEGITVLVTNSPNLLTCHIYLKCFDLLGGLEREDFLLTLKEKFHDRKLFTMGGFKLEQECYVEYEQHTNLQSLWNFPFWDQVKVCSVPLSSDTDDLTDYDNHSSTHRFQLHDNFPHDHDLLLM